MFQSVSSDGGRGGVQRGREIPHWRRRLTKPPNNNSVLYTAPSISKNNPAARERQKTEPNGRSGYWNKAAMTLAAVTSAGGPAAAPRNRTALSACDTATSGMKRDRHPMAEQVVRSRQWLHPSHPIRARHSCCRGRQECERGEVWMEIIGEEFPPPGSEPSATPGAEGQTLLPAFITAFSVSL